MNYSPVGVIGQIFIIEAITFYCEKVIEKGVEEPKEGDAVQFISPKAWHYAAKDILARIELNYKER
jgi:hypothetical protein